MKTKYFISLMAAFVSIVFLSCNKPTAPVGTSSNEISKKSPIMICCDFTNITFVDNNGNIIDSGILDRLDAPGSTVTISSLFLACLETSKHDYKNDDSDHDKNKDKDKDKKKDDKKDDKKDKKKNKNQCGDGSDKDEDYENHGAYVSCMAHITQDLVKNGVLTSQERAIIMAAAAKSAEGK